MSTDALEEQIEKDVQDARRAILETVFRNPTVPITARDLKREACPPDLSLATTGIALRQLVEEDVLIRNDKTYLITPVLEGERVLALLQEAVKTVKTAMFDLMEADPDRGWVASELFELANRHNYSSATMGIAMHQLIEEDRMYFDQQLKIVFLG